LNKPKPAQVLFERILRENGIAQRLTKPASPTTTGKIERFHKRCALKLLDDADPFPDLTAAQAAIDAWVAEYNTSRPHQSLGGATPAQRFTADRTSAPDGPDGDGPVLLPLRTPAELAEPSPTRGAVQFDVVVPASGKLWIAGRQLWLGTGWAEHTVTVWADLTCIHLSVDRVGLKTLPSRFSANDLTKLRRRPGARDGSPRPR
jgi:Integrase core domain